MKRLISFRFRRRMTHSSDGADTRRFGHSCRKCWAALSSFLAGRRLVCSAAALLCAAVITAALAGQAPVSQRYDPTQKIDVDLRVLREQLVKGLRITRKDQETYIDSVIERVAKKTLPVTLVYASFRYARLRHQSYPFPYFVYCLETLERRQRK